LRIDASCASHGFLLRFGQDEFLLLLQHHHES
jgi:GGDEF domain-containing protein